MKKIFFWLKNLIEKCNFYFIIEVTTVIVAIGAIVMSICNDFFSNSLIPHWIISKYENISENMFDLFSIQATIATMSVAITALISGMINETVYGITISHYISQLKPKILKHRLIIIINLTLTFINYFLISLGLNNTSISVFFVSILISIRLVYDVYIVFTGTKKIRINIESYILKNYKKCIEDVNYQVQNCKNQNNILVLNQNLDLIEKIYDKALSDVNKKNAKNIDIINELNEILNSVLDYATDKKEANTIVHIFNNIYNIYHCAINKHNNCPIYLWDYISHNFFTAISSLSFSNLRYECHIGDIHNLIIENQVYNEEKRNYPLNARNIYWFSSQVYQNLNFETPQNSDYKESLICSLNYDIIDCIKKYSNNEIYKTRNDLLLSEVCYLFKKIIYNRDEKIIKNVYFKYISLNNEFQDHIIFTILILYLYYLSVQSNWKTKKYIKDFAAEFLLDNKETITCILLDINFCDISKKIQQITHALKYPEEYIDGENNVIFIDDAIIDFLIFTSLNKQTEEETYEVIKNISSNTYIFELYMRYSNRDETIKRIREFNEVIFSYSAGNEEKFMATLENLLNKIYKEYEIQEGLHNPVTNSDEDKYKRLVSDKMNLLINEKLNIFDSSLIPDIEYEDKIFTTDRFITKNRFQKDLDLVYIASEAYEALETEIVNILKEKILIKEIGTKDNNKQQTIIDLAEQNSIKPNTFLGKNRRYHTEKNSRLLEEYIKNYKIIEIKGGIKNNYLVNSKQYHLYIDDIKVEITTLTDEEIKRYCKNITEDKADYNVTNNIYIPFSVAELNEHIYRTKRKLTITVKYRHMFVSDTIGVGIEIKPSSSSLTKHKK